MEREGDLSKQQGPNVDRFTQVLRSFRITPRQTTIPTTSVRKCANTRKPPCKYLADLRDVFVKKKSELYKPPLRLYTTFQKY
ncbi:hypothetical protein OUZ56_032276 [Daphnia magna]|uniref:Uncharacterized protein n=1 Tax=Daphnia magna TaxID=35525 RepID=A0ABQ9ZWN7_9CRUS|nr:hypothetical protein OUZ56_032276 [Daphnia magna]